jgi:hypothetical protein
MKGIETKPNNFRFVETKKTTGLVEEIGKLADLEGRSLNNYVGQVLKKHVLQKSKRNLGNIQDHNDTNNF